MQSAKGLQYIFCFWAAAIIISCNHKNTLFQLVAVSKSKIDFSNNLDSNKAYRALYFFYLYNGGGVAVGDINNDGLADIYFTANSKGNNKLYLNKGGLQFEDITEKAGVAGNSDWYNGVTMADINGDGFLDIYVSSLNNVYNLKGKNELFINNKGNGTFTENAAQYGLDISAYCNQAVFFDYDHDGDLDCYILNESFKPSETLSDTSGRRRVDINSGDRFLRNDVNSKGKFTDVSASVGVYQGNVGYGLAVSVADINNDGWEDIYVGNDFQENDYYYVNKGNGTFNEEGASHFNHYSRFSMGNDIADYNNDGQLDIFTADMLPQDEKFLKTYGSGEAPDIYDFMIAKNGYQNQYSKNCLQRNNGSGVSFSETALLSGVAATDWSWCPLFADFDNDGNKDLFITSGIVKRTVDLDYIRFLSDIRVVPGQDKKEKYNVALSKMPDGISHSYIYKGDGKLFFTDKSKEWGFEKYKGYFNGAAYADLDNDGDLDLVVNAINAPAQIYQNNAPPLNFISLVLKGNDGNTNGIGAKAYIFTAGKMQYQQLMLTRGFQSSSDTRLHFGLDAVKIIDSILIVWPNQNYQILKKVTANQQLNIIQNDAGSVFNYYTFFPYTKELFTDISGQTACNWRHVENDFTDFNLQYLIPHKQSTRGPKITVADVNRDGLDDFYACGANGQPGCLMQQTKDGKFYKSDTALFSKNINREEVDAVFFDADKDGFPDLFVVSGGNEYADGNTALADKLYMNDGKGSFSLSDGRLPFLLKNKSCVVVADVDNDGDNDLFAGGLADAKKYGLPQSSFLLVNDGKGNFKHADENIIALDKTGIVTAATFADINNDGWPDLIVAGEWMAVTIFINNKGKFRKTEIPASTGLWQTVFATDINGDGFTDILAGNWGHNSKLYAGKNGPLKLYVKDFDKNGAVEQVMAYTVDGKEYPFLAKDELEKALPVLKKAYLTYGEVAGKTVQYMFFDLFKDYTELKAETLSSTCFINDGKGNFTAMPLPDALQFAPVFSFAALGNNNYIAAGNFYGVIPYEGRYDALQPTFFSYQQQPSAFNVQGLLPALGGEVRDIKWLKYGDEKKILLVARNNDSLVFLKPTK